MTPVSEEATADLLTSTHYAGTTRALSEQTTLNVLHRVNVRA